MKARVLILFLSAGITLMCSDGERDIREQSKIKIEKIDYHGWKDSYKLSNEKAEVVVVPAIGRIMYFGLRSGENILWNNPDFFGKTLQLGKPLAENDEIIWANFGGDKVWSTQEDNWPDINGYSWPPDHWFDGSEHSAELLTNGIRITSPVSEYCGARSIREIILTKDGTELTINQTIKKVMQSANPEVEPVNYTIWNVTQIRPPLMTLMNLNPNSSLDMRYKLMRPNTAENFSVEGDIGIILPDSIKKQKAGADSDYWLAAIIDNMVFGEFFRFHQGEVYPDGGVSAEVYTEPDYTEIELLSPLRQLAIGESMHFSIVWRLHQLSADIKTDTEKKTAALAWLNTFIE